MSAFGERTSLFSPVTLLPVAPGSMVVMLVENFTFRERIEAEVHDYSVIEGLTEKISPMADDADWRRKGRSRGRRRDGRVHSKSFFDGYEALAKASVDLLITSPPYWNNYHYNRNTRPHLYWLGLCKAPRDLKHLETLNCGTYRQNARDQEQVELDANYSRRRNSQDSCRCAREESR